MPKIVELYLLKPAWDSYKAASYLENPLGWRLTAIHALPESKIKVFTQDTSTLLLHDHRTTGVVYMELYDALHPSLELFPDLYQQTELPALVSPVSELETLKNIERICLSCVLHPEPWKYEFIKNCLLQGTYSAKAVATEGIQQSRHPEYAALVHLKDEVK